MQRTPAYHRTELPPGNQWSCCLYEPLRLFNTYPFDFLMYWIYSKCWLTGEITDLLFIFHWRSY